MLVRLLSFTRHIYTWDLPKSTIRCTVTSQQIILRKGSFCHFEIWQKGSLLSPANGTILTIDAPIEYQTYWTFYYTNFKHAWGAERSQYLSFYVFNNPSLSILMSPNFENFGPHGIRSATFEPKSGQECFH